MGELHLEIIVDRLKREFNVEANVGKPQVAYKETITKRGRGRGPVHQADRWPRSVRSREDSPDSAQAGRRLPVREQDRRRHDSAEFIKPIDEGIQEALTTGVLAGLPDGRRAASSCTTARTTTSTRTKWRSRSPGRWRSRMRPRRRSPVLLEPVMRVEVVVPEEFMGDIIGDLDQPARPHPVAWKSAAARRSSARACRCRRCSATRPTCGRARRAARTYSMHFDRYEQAPGHVADEVIARMQGTSSRW